MPAGRLDLVDLQPQMLSKARRKLERLRSRRLGYTAADAGVGLPFRAATFDCAILLAVLGEVQDSRVCLDELRRVLEETRKTPRFDAPGLAL